MVQMAETFLLEINLPVLKQSLEDVEKQRWRDDEVLAFLASCGFVQAGNRWIVEEAGLKILSQSDFQIIETIE